MNVLPLHCSKLTCGLLSRPGMFAMFGVSLGSLLLVSGESELERSPPSSLLSKAAFLVSIVTRVMISFNGVRDHDPGDITNVVSLLPFHTHTYRSFACYIFNRASFSCCKLARFWMTLFQSPSCSWQRE